jgi:hypothetical protein
MEADTLSDPDVVRTHNKEYVSVKLDADREKEATSRFSPNGYPDTVVLNPEGEMIGRIEGYYDAKEYMGQLAGIRDKYAKLKALLEKAKAAPDDLLLAKEVAEGYSGLGIYARAAEWFRKVADGVKRKEKPSDDERRARAVAIAAIIDISIRTTRRDDKLGMEKIEGLAKEGRAADPENAFGTLDDVIVAESAVLATRDRTEEALKLAKEGYEKYPTADKAALLLFIVAGCQDTLKKLDDMKATLKELVVKFPETDYGKRAKAILESYEKE